MNKQQIELNKTRDFAKKVRKKMGLFPNPESSENERIYIGLTNNKLTKGKRYCPCFVIEGDTEEERKSSDNRICPCEPAIQIEIPETGRCHCGIFCTDNYVENYAKVKIDDVELHPNLTSEELNAFFEKKEIDSMELVSLLNARIRGLVNFILIDVREIIENDTKMIIGMDYLIPTSDLKSGLNGVSDKKKENIVVHCHSGSRSSRVQEIMKNIGFETVINLKGGISSYKGEIK